MCGNGIIDYSLFIVNKKLNYFDEIRKEETLFATINREAEKRGISIRQLELKAGLGNGTIRGWETSSPTLDSLEKVAEVLGLKTTTLIARSKK